MVDPSVFEKFCGALVSSFDADASIRQEAEDYLNTVSRSPGVMDVLLMVIKHNEVPDAGRSAAAVMLKNKVKRSWVDSSKVSEEEKERIKNALYPALLEIGASKSLIWRQILECFRIIIFHDFVSISGDLLAVIHNDLQQRENSTRLHVALAVLKKLTVGATDNEQLKNIITVTLPSLLLAAYDLIKVGIDKPEVAQMLKIICRIYWSCLEVSVVASKMFVEAFDEWMQLIEFIVLHAGNTPSSIKGDCNSDLEKLPFFKLQKRAMQIVHLFFVRFGKKGSDRSVSSTVSLRETFLDKWAGRFIQIYLDTLQKKRRGEVMVTESMEQLILEFFTEGFEVASIYKRYLKPNGEFLLFQVCFPMMLYNQEDRKKWEEDSVEYVREQCDDVSDFGLLQSPRLSAKMLVKKLARLRGKDFLKAIYDFVNDIVQTYEVTQPQSSEQQQLLVVNKDGALQMLSCIAERLTGSRRAFPIEEFLHRYVYIDFCSTHELLRFRACSTYNDFLRSIKAYKNTGILLETYKAMIECTADKELTVRLGAATCVQAFFRFKISVLSDTIIASLPQLLERLFYLINETDCDMVVMTVATLVDSLKQKIIPYAKALISTLSQSLVKTIQNELEEEEEDASTAILTTSSILHTIISFLEVIRETPAVYEELYSLLIPALEALFSVENIEYLEEGLEILSFLTFYLPEMPIELWIFFEKMCDCVCGEGSYYIEGEESDVMENASMLPAMLTPLEGYMFKGIQYFTVAHTKEGLPYKQLVMKVAAKCIAAEVAVCQSLELLCIFFEVMSKSKGADEILAPACHLLIPLLSSLDMQDGKLETETKRMVLRLLATLLFYNGPVFFAIIEQSNQTQTVFEQWIKHMAFVEKMQENKMMILGLTEYLRCLVQRKDTVPPCLTGASVVEQILAQIGNKVMAQMKLREKRKSEALESSSDMDSTDSMDSEQELEEDEDAQARTSRAAGVGLDAVDGYFDEEEEEEDDDSFNYEDIVDHSLRLSPLGETDELQYLAETLSIVPEDTRQQLVKWLGTQEIASLISNGQ